MDEQREVRVRIVVVHVVEVSGTRRFMPTTIAFGNVGANSFRRGSNRLNHALESRENHD